MQKSDFATDLTDAQWEYLELMLPKPSPVGRPRTPLRIVVDALLYLPWKLLPKNFPPHKTEFHIFNAWNKNGTMAALNNRLRAFAREREGYRSRPTAAIRDSQTVRSAELAAETGYDAAKRTKGRKRFIMVDTMGHVLAALALPANLPERQGAQQWLDEALGAFELVEQTVGGWDWLG